MIPLRLPLLMTILLTTFILFTQSIGRLSPSAGQISFQFGQHERALYLLDLTSKLTIQLARGTNPYPNYTWSPDGSQLAYVAPVNGKGDLFSVDIRCASWFTSCGTPLNLTHHREADSEPAWSPDGTGLIFVSERNGAPELYWIAATGGTAYNLTNDSATDSFPVWSPDGHYLAFYSDRSGNFEVYVMNMACLRQLQSCPTAIHRLGGGFNSLPAWSPDSQHLAYFANGDILLTPTACLAQSNDCHLHARNLTRSAYTDWAPAWLPDSQHLLFQSNRDNHPETYIADIACSDTNTTCTVRFDTDLIINGSADVAPDKRHLVLIANDGDHHELFMLPIDGGESQQLTHFGGQILNPRWRPAQP